MNNNNKLIAEFMGWGTTDVDNKLIEPAGMRDTWTTEEMLFATDWNWLMPVVQKCYKIDNEEGFDNLVDAVSTLYLGGTYDAVVEFIKTYNNQDTEDEACDMLYGVDNNQ